MFAIQETLLKSNANLATLCEIPLDYSCYIRRRFSPSIAMHFEGSQSSSMEIASETIEPKDHEIASPASTRSTNARM